MNLSYTTLDRSAFTEIDRRKHTLQRAEEMVQAMIWDSARKLKKPAASLGSA
jgi:hypothetical protein